MLEAITTNQIREKDKVEVLRKHLKGEAKLMIGQHYQSLGKAFEALIKHFGLVKKTWEHKLKNFSSNCKKPDAWAAVGTPQRRAVISNVCEFLREAEKIANVHRDLKDQIINHVTIGKIFEVLPPKIIEKIFDLVTGPHTKVVVTIQNIKTVLDKQLLHS